MTDIREAVYVLVVGAPGFGKSTWIVKKLDKGVRKNVLVYKSDMAIDDAAFKSYKRIHRLEDYRGGKAKISDLDIEYLPLLRKVIGTKERKYQDGFKNAALVVDDAGWFEGHAISNEFKQLLRMRRHLGLDVYYVYHGLTDVPIAHFPFTSSIVLFHTVDNAEYKARKLPMGGDKLLAARDALAKLVEAGIKYQPMILKLT